MVRTGEELESDALALANEGKLLDATKTFTAAISAYKSGSTTRVDDGARPMKDPVEVLYNRGVCYLAQQVKQGDY